jgi:hypothetical protein
LRLLIVHHMRLKDYDCSTSKMFGNKNGSLKRGSARVVARGSLAVLLVDFLKRVKIHDFASPAFVGFAFDSSNMFVLNCAIISDLIIGNLETQERKKLPCHPDMA